MYLLNLTQIKVPALKWTLFEINHKNRLLYILTNMKVKNNEMLFKGLSYHHSFDV